MSKKIEIKEQFDYGKQHKDIKQALNYEYRLYAKDSYDSYMWQIETTLLLKEVSLIKKAKIRYLDFACGTGRILSLVERYVDESTGLDVSESMLSIAKGKIKKSLLIKGDLTKNDVLRNTQYDLITAFRFFLNAQANLKEEIMLLLSEKLSNDGILVFNIHGNITSYYFLPIVLPGLKNDWSELNYSSYFKINNLIKNSRLKIKRVYGVGFIPSLFYRLFKFWKKFFINIEKILSNLIFLKYFAKNLIFICIKK